MGEVGAVRLDRTDQPRQDAWSGFASSRFENCDYNNLAMRCIALLSLVVALTGCAHKKATTMITPAWATMPPLRQLKSRDGTKAVPVLPLHLVTESFAAKTRGPADAYVIGTDGTVWKLGPNGSRTRTNLKTPPPLDVVPGTNSHSATYRDAEGTIWELHEGVTPLPPLAPGR